MSSTMHDDNLSHGNELLERAVSQLQATEQRDDMPREVSDRILTIVGAQPKVECPERLIGCSAPTLRTTAQIKHARRAQGSVPAKTSTRRFIVWQIITISVLAGAVFLAVGSLRNGQQDGPSAVEQNKIESTTPHPGEAADQHHDGGSTDVDVDPEAGRPQARSIHSGTAADQWNSGQTSEGVEASSSEADLNGHIANRRPALEQLNEMVQHGDPQVVPILRRQLVIESEWLAQDDKASLLIQAIDGLGQFGDRQVLDTIVEIYRPRRTVPRIRDSAAMAIARIGAKSELELLKRILWDDRLSIRTRCECAVTLLNLDVSEAAEFLLAQYDLYRLERRMDSGLHLDPVREALERLGNEQILITLDQRLKDEGHIKMQNNIRTLKERMSLNRLSLDELRRIAANPDWKEARSRYPVMRVLGDRGEPDLIPFLETLKPWHTDFERNKKVVEGHNRIVWPEYVAETIASIRRRHWETPAKDERK